MINLLHLNILQCIFDKNMTIHKNQCIQFIFIDEAWKMLIHAQETIVRMFADNKSQFDSQTSYKKLYLVFSLRGDFVMKIVHHFS